MKKNIKNLFKIVITVLATITLLTSCEDFAEGFRYGWNSTVPSEYRY